jgi:hypothetical protein
MPIGSARITSERIVSPARLSRPTRLCWGRFVAAAHAPGEPVHPAFPGQTSDGPVVSVGINCFLSCGSASERGER